MILRSLLVANILSKLYSAAVSAGAGVNTARRAANALADYENRFAKLERELGYIKLMLAGVLALLAIAIIKLFAG